MKNIVLGISGGSCIELALAFIKLLPEDVFLHVVISDNAEILFSAENTFKNHFLKSNNAKSLKNEGNNIQNKNNEVQHLSTHKGCAKSQSFISRNIQNTQKSSLSLIIESLKKNIEICKNIDNKLSSGSYKFDSMIVLPTSVNTLGMIANGIANNLLTRVAAVCLKERRELILALREMPFSAIMLKNMYELSLQNVIIAPPVLGYYAVDNKLESMEKFIIGKYFDLLKIEHDLFRRWQ